ncbi:hypothetical protein ACELLULO517_28340, partial [Acidisoma cellulosilytica]
TYTVAASATALPAAGGSSLASAQNLGTLGTVSTTQSGWIGAIASNDYYSFTLSDLSSVALKFSGLSNNGAYLYVLDASGNQVGYATPTYDPAQPITLNLNLAAGHYFILVQDSSNTAYTLTATSDGVTGTAPVAISGTTLSTANLLGALTSAPVVLSDFVGSSEPNGWYQFTLGSLSDVS